MFPDRLKLPPAFCPESLEADLDRLDDEAWIEHFVTQNFDRHSKILPLRGPEGAEHPVMMCYSDPTCSRFADTPYLKKCPYFQEVLASFPFPLHCVRLMTLPPGSMIKEHCDHDLAFEYGAVRLHVPIRTNRLVEFHLNGRRVEMFAGECWYLRLSDPHHVFNGGAEVRIHMVIDAPVDPGVETLLNSAVR